MEQEQEAIATASAVVANIIDIVKKGKQSNFAPLGFAKLSNEDKDDNTSSKTELKPLKLAPKNKIQTKYYLRLKVQDKSGILAIICKILSDENISIKNLFQKNTTDNAMVSLSTHSCLESDIKKALNNLEKSNLLLDEAVLIRIED